LAWATAALHNGEDERLASRPHSSASVHGVASVGGVPTAHRPIVARDGSVTIRSKLALGLFANLLILLAPLAFALYVAVAIVWLVPDRRLERALDRSR